MISASAVNSSISPGTNFFSSTSGRSSTCSLLLRNASATARLIAASNVSWLSVCGSACFLTTAIGTCPWRKPLTLIFLAIRLSATCSAVSSSGWPAATVTRTRVADNFFTVVFITTYYNRLYPGWLFLTNYKISDKSKTSSSSSYC